MEIRGNFEQQLETKTGTGKNGNWEATSFMIEVPGQYPKHPVFELFNNTDAIVGLQVGQPITVSFDLDSSEWNGKRFPKVKAYKVQLEQVAQQPTPPIQGGGEPMPVVNSAPVQDVLPY